MAKILVMDDEEMIRDVMSDLIECLGHSCITSVCGEDAVELYKESLKSNNKFDLVILDYHVKNGLGALKTSQLILQIDENAPLVISSGDPELPEMRNYIDHKFCDCLAKPCKVNELQSLFLRQNIN